MKKYLILQILVVLCSSWVLGQSSTQKIRRQYADTTNAYNNAWWLMMDTSRFDYQQQLKYLLAKPDTVTGYGSLYGFWNRGLYWNGVRVDSVQDTASLSSRINTKVDKGDSVTGIQYVTKKRLEDSLASYPRTVVVNDSLSHKVNRGDSTWLFITNTKLNDTASAIRNSFVIYVDSVWRVAGKDSIFWRKNGITYAFRDSVGSGATDTTSLSNRINLKKDIADSVSGTGYATNSDLLNYPLTSTLRQGAYLSDTTKYKLISDSTDGTGYFTVNKGALKADKATTMTIAGTANQITSSAGAQDLSANRTWTLSTPQDIHTAANPQFAGLGLGVSNTGLQTLTMVNGSTFGLHNITPDATNYERIRLSWSSNRAFLLSESGGTGTARDLFLGAHAGSSTYNTIYMNATGNPRIRIGFYNSSLTVQNTGLGSGADWMRIGEITSTATSAISIVAIKPTYNQTGAGGGTDLLINRTETAVGSGAQNLIDAQVGGTSRFKIDNKGNTTLTQPVITSGSPTLLTLTGGAHTTLTASTEAIGANFNFSATKQFATGALATQREVVFQAPTYSAVGASTFTNAATVSITGAPTAGTNMTITNPISLQVAAGATRLDGGFGMGIQPTATYGGYLYKSQGSTFGIKVENPLAATDNNPQAIVVVQSDADNMSIFANASGSVDRPGVVGLASDANASMRLWNQANTNMDFYTNNAKVGVFDNNGNFGIGNITPTASLDVQNKFTVNSSGQIVKINNITPEGAFAVPVIVDSVTRGNRTASITATNFVNAGTAGMYEVGGYVEVTGTSAGNTLTVTIGWTDAVGATTTNAINALSTTTATRSWFSPIPIKIASGNITWATTVSAGTPTYQLHLWCKRLW